MKVWILTLFVHSLFSSLPTYSEDSVFASQKECERAREYVTMSDVKCVEVKVIDYDN